MIHPVLLLDSSWRIDRVIDTERACELLIERKAVPATEDIAVVMRSMSLTVEVPSVVAMLQTRGRRSAAAPLCTMYRVRVRDRHECQFVIDGRPCERVGRTVDHLVPSSRGGPGSWTNLACACEEHNSVKADRTLDEMSFRFGWRLKRDPFVPTRSVVVEARVPKHPASWGPYLVAG